MLPRHSILFSSFRASEMDFLFPHPNMPHQKIGSAALIPLQTKQPSSPPGLGILAIGSEDPDHFKRTLGTLFLQHIGEVLSRVLEQRL